MSLPKRPSSPPALSRLTFGMVPVTDNEHTRVVLGDFCALLSDALKIKVAAHRAPTPAALAWAMAAGRVQFGWISPTLLVTSPQLQSLVPLLSSVRQGFTAYHGALFVAGDSPIQTLEDLAGRRAAWVANTSASGYIFPRVTLAQRGLDPRTLFAAEEFFGSHGGVTAAVVEGRADVGATFAVYEAGDPRLPLVRAGFSEMLGEQDARVLDVAGPIPADMIAAVAELPAQLRATITVVMQRIHEDARSATMLRELFGVDSFEAFSASSKPVLRSLVSMAREVGLAASENSAPV